MARLIPLTPTLPGGRGRKTLHWASVYLDWRSRGTGVIQMEEEVERRRKSAKMDLRDKPNPNEGYEVIQLIGRNE